MDLKRNRNETKIWENRGFSISVSTNAPKNLSLCQSPSISSPPPPPPSFIKMNFDGASKGNPRPTRLGGVLRDHSGKILHIYSHHLGHDTNNGVALSVLMEGLRATKTNGDNKLIIEGDSAIIITMCQHIIHITSPTKTSHSWKLLTMLEELLVLLARIPITSISHVKRDANKVANYLANQGVENPNTKLNAASNNHILAIVHNKCATLALQDMKLPGWGDTWLTSPPT